MKHFNKFLLPIAALGMSFIFSCNTDDLVPEIPEEPETPPTTTAPAPPPPSVEGTWGALIAAKMTFGYSQMGINVDVVSEMGIGGFYTAMNSTTMVDAGTVKLNNIALDLNENKSYSKVASMGQTPENMGIGSGISWNVTGGNGIPAFTYTHAGGFPNFTGTIPETVTRANGLALTLNNSTVSNADSVYVYIISGSTSLMKNYAATAGPIVIEASDLNGLTASSTESPAYVEIIPWKYIVYEVSAGKPIAFIKENIIAKSVTIN